MAINRMILNETSYFGPKSREVISSEFASRGYQKAMVVTDKSLVEAGITGKVLEVLDTEFIPYEVFSDVKPNPTVSCVKAGIEQFQNSGADCLIAVGGGSVIDTAKAIGIVVKNPEFSDVVSLVGVADTKNRSVPIIALPTTAGTAAEVTINYVITDEKSVNKLVCVDPHDIPVLSIIDTELMAGMPENIAAWTGLDALTHAIEGYITKASWCMTDMMHLKAIQMIFENLVSAVKDKDEEAINNMGIAQYIAGMGFSNVGLGIVHSMAHPLGAVYDTPHGLANALLLPYVMEWNGEVCVQKFEEIGTAIGLDMNALTKDEIIQKVVDKVRNLSIQLGVPQHLSEIGVKQEDLKMLAKKAIIDPCTGGNPRNVTVNDILELYKKAF
ncbi:MAG: lactaldehyde reductase [Bacilli bacterium]|nr:lactaldehyde reductase [Bacilli bacterium]